MPTLAAIIGGGAVLIGSAILTGGLSLVGLVAAGATAYAGYNVTADALPETFYLPVYVLSPEEIFKNKIALLDVNFFNPNEYEDIQTESGEVIQQPESTASQLQGTIASWYIALRNFALIVLLSVLLYIGIRIVTSSVAQDKAKYKEKLWNWIVAVCLLFFMHYIMSFATTIVEAISEGINEVNKPILLNIELTDAYHIETTGEDENGEVTTGTQNAIEFFQDNNLTTTDGNGNTMYLWPSNLMGTVRLEMQLEPPDLDEDNVTLRKLGYTVLFIILVIYTVAFLVVYIKRLIMLAFLTIIAPLVAMTYPIDKLHDGNAQAFNMWLKEYIFNLLIQPLHLILYTIFVGSAIDFAKDNLIYAIVAIGFIFQAEKIMRKFFGFDKASTLEGGSAIGGALAMAGINQLRRLGGGGSKKPGKANQNSQNRQNDRVRTADRNRRTSDLLNETYGNGSNQNNPHNVPPRDENREGQYDSNQYDANQGQNEEQNQGQTMQQRMLDAYDENYGTNNYDTAERETMARDAYEPERIDYSEEEYRNILRDSGYSEDEINNMVRQDPRYANNNQEDNNIDTTVTTERGTQEPDNSQESYGNRRSANKPIRRPSRIRGVAAVAGKGARYIAPKAARLAVRGGLAATAGIIGVSAGLASDNDMNILKYGAAGVGAGWVAGSGASRIADGLDETIKNTKENIASTYTLAAKGEKAEKERQIAAMDKEAMKDKERRRKYAEELGLKSKGDITKALKEAQKYRESGIVDDKLILKAMQEEGFGDRRDSDERIILAGLASEVGNDNKKIKDLEERLKQRGLTQEDVTKYINGIRNINGAV